LQTELEMFECFTKVIIEEEGAELKVEEAGIMGINGQMSSPGAKREGGCGIWPPAAERRRVPRVSAAWLI
jgi:hypothetical protein